MSRQSNYHLWTERVSAYRESKLTLVAWCQENNISKSTMHYWITKLNKEATTSHIEWGSISIDDSSNVVPSDVDSGISLSVQGIEIKLQQNFHTNTLHNLLQVIHSYA